MQLGDSPSSPFDAVLRRRRSLVSLPTARRATSLSPRWKHAPGAKWEKPHRINREELFCPICFDILCFPVTLPCGHNFDRGCLLTAWEHERPSPRASTMDTGSHACPLCRQRTPAATAPLLQVNLVLKKLITAQFPLEIQSLESEGKRRGATAVSTTTSAPTTPSERRRLTWRTATSFFYVWLASVTEPPGFVLAVLLLISLLAIAITPQQMLSSPTSLPTLFEGMDGIIKLVREIAFRMDQLDQIWPWMRVFSFIL